MALARETRVLSYIVKPLKPEPLAEMLAGLETGRQP